MRGLGLAPSANVNGGGERGRGGSSAAAVISAERTPINDQSRNNAIIILRALNGGDAFEMTAADFAEQLELTLLRGAGVGENHRRNYCEP